MATKKRNAKPRAKPDRKDDVRQADESGEPTRSGRSHGHFISKDGTSAGGEAQPGPDENWESGQHNAVK
jgi:hypothetical protein